MDKIVQKQLAGRKTAIFDKNILTGVFFKGHRIHGESGIKTAILAYFI
jgi:hypothetical protein